MTTAGTTKTWEDVAAGKQAAREALIPDEWRLPKETLANLPKNVLDIPRTSGLLTARELEITETTAPRLVEKLIARTYTSLEVTTAFAKRAIIAHQLTNCLTEIFIEEGLAAAKAIDDEYAQTGKPKGPLHGLPISLKDCINLPGYDSTIGIVSFANKPKTEEDASELARILREAGAVFYVKTNVPTGMLAIETVNNVWGVTPNPYNSDYGSGGSSGGEGALLALRGAPLGVGTDIGGSIRVPAAVNGVYGLKAAGGRFISLGISAGLKGQESVKSTAGPMAPDLESLSLYSKVVIGAKPWELDPTTFAIPWREVEVPEKLAFGLIIDNGLVRPTPAVERVLRETKAALEAAGHKVVEYKPYDVEQANTLLLRLLGADGADGLYNLLRAGEYPEPWPKGFEILEGIYQKYKDNPPKVGALWAAQADRNAYLRKLLKQWADSKEVTGTGRAWDGVITATLPNPAHTHYNAWYSGYTNLWNVADFTGVDFPAGVSKKTDTKPEGFEARNDTEKKAWDDYNAEGLDGIPIGLQLITPRHTEELGLKLTEVVVAALDKAKK
ncbi:hypothetical protein VHUM_03945 [Vanrija humicola]|uniref:amidase n=1 Tax=Vanrija humicola TaxID=5417 RepID=A0A7D8YZC2_VANHU|nr:hypothetical protein VHUM_03945 [Vanrija humicola]